MAKSKTYPVRLTGDDAISKAVEDWINEQMKNWTSSQTGIFETHQIATNLNATGRWRLTAEDISKVLDFDNGITVTR